MTVDIFEVLRRQLADKVGADYCDSMEQLLRKAIDKINELEDALHQIE